MAFKLFWWPQIFHVWQRCEPEVVVVVPGMACLVTLFFWGVSWHDPVLLDTSREASNNWLKLHCWVMVVELLQGHTHTHTHILFLYPRVMYHGSQHCSSGPGSLGALFVSLVQYSLWQYPNPCYLSNPNRTDRRWCSVLWSNVGAPKGNPLLLSTSDTLWSDECWCGKLWFCFFQVFIQGKGWRI